MITTTPVARARSHSRDAMSLPSRPTTPLRPASRASLRPTTPTSNLNGGSSTTPNANGADFVLAHLEPAFAELSDSMADLEANFMHLQLLNESMARFNENFAAFLYGLNMTAFCVDFPEAPITQSFARHGSTTNQLDDSPFRAVRPTQAEEGGVHDAGADATFMTGDTSFVEHPPASTKSSRHGGAGMPPGARRGTAARGAVSNRGAASIGRPVSVAGVDANGRRTTRLPASRGRGSTTTATTSTRGRGSYSRT